MLHPRRRGTDWTLRPAPLPPAGRSSPIEPTLRSPTDGHQPSDAGVEQCTDERAECED